MIVCLGVFKAFFKFLLPRRIRRERKARQPLAFGVEFNQARSQVLCRGLCLGLCLLPLVAAEFIEPDRRIFAGTDILADQIQLCCGHIQTVRALIGDLDVILCDAADLQLLHADITADAMVLVYDEVTGGQIGKRVKFFAVCGFFGRSSPFALLPNSDLPLR